MIYNNRTVNTVRHQCVILLRISSGRKGALGAKLCNCALCAMHFSKEVNDGAAFLQEGPSRNFWPEARSTKGIEPSRKEIQV